MSEKFRLDRKIWFQNTFYTKCINVINIYNIGPSIILRSIYTSNICVQHTICKMFSIINLIADNFAVNKKHIRLVIIFCIQ